jgi:hypothetical protein
MAIVMTCDACEQAITAEDERYVTVPTVVVNAPGAPGPPPPDPDEIGNTPPIPAEHYHEDCWETIVEEGKKAAKSKRQIRDK